MGCTASNEKDIVQPIPNQQQQSPQPEPVIDRTEKSPQH